MNDQDTGLKPALYLVGTPIGNLEDITLRALRILKLVDLIAAEDTRHTRKLLNHFDIDVKTLSYREENHDKASKEIVNTITAGKAVALVTDAGMPCISDPGIPLVQLCLEEGLAVEVIPGVSAVITAIARAAFSHRGFKFAGFPPTKTNARKDFFEKYANSSLPLVFFEAPHRLVRSLEDLLTVAGDRSILIGRELTKMHEDYLQDKLSVIIEKYQGSETPRGEFTLVLAPAENTDSEKTFSEAELQTLFRKMTESGIHPKEAIKALALQTGLQRNYLYNLLRKDE